VDPLRGDACDGARPLRAGGQGGLQAQPRLGRGGGRRLYVAARLLPAGLLCGRAGSLPLPALQGRQPAREAVIAMSRIVTAQPLTRAAFAKFGDVLDTDWDNHFPINAGRCRRYHDLAKVEATGPEARVLISIFR